LACVPRIPTGDAKLPIFPTATIRDQRGAEIMRQLFLIVTIAALAGCGVETVTTAATGAAIKKQEIEQGKKTQEDAQRKIDQAMQQMQQRANQPGDAAGR
jgi:RecA/RadA recombinase